MPGNPPTRPGDDADERPFDVNPHHCFGCGELNLGGLHLQLHIGERRAWAATTLSSTFEGWEGIAHGGVIASILDEVMAWSLASLDSLGVTATITVDYKKPVPVGQPLRADGWITATKRRVFETAGSITDPADGTVLATATAVFVAADRERADALRMRYGIRTGDTAGGTGTLERAASATPAEPGA
jgi:acyl-coenzyme A thioesterase PaaI-like protein